MNSQPLVDTNTLIALETFFRPGPTDPWSVRLLGHFVDLFVYSDRFRFTLPLPNPEVIDPTIEPVLVHQLRSHESEVVQPAIYSTAEPRVLRDELLAPCLESFEQWITPPIRQRSLRDWLATHHLPWVRGLHEGQVVRDHVFDLGKLEENPRFGHLAARLGLEHRLLAYALDNVLRFPIYGEMTGEDEFYLHHDLRDAFPDSSLRQEKGRRPNITVSWSEAATSLARDMTQEEFVAFLHELRWNVRTRGIHLLKREEVDRELVREVAASVQLPSRLRGMNEFTGAATGFLSGMALLPELGAASTLLAAALSVSGAIWKGRLPRAASRWRWLRWAVRWNEEDTIVSK